MEKPEKIQVLSIIKSLGRGGAETLLPETLRYHNQHVFDFHYIYFLPWKNQLVSELEQAGGKVINFSARNNFEIISQVSHVIAYCKANNISIIHSHLPWAGFVGRLIHWKTGIPVLYTEHNEQERYHFITRWLNRVTFNMQNIVLAVSEKVNLSIRKNIHANIPVQTILNGIDTVKFKRNHEKGEAIKNKLGISSEAIVIGNLSVFRVQKRIDVWLDLFSKAYAVHPEIRGILVGDGPLKDQILAKRRALGLDDVVYMPGLQTNAADWYAAMDIFMISSQFEGLPLALLESMACECAVISTNAGGIKEVVRNNEDGILIETDDFNWMESQLLDLIVNKQRKDQFAVNARKRVEEKFSITQMVQEIEKLYLQYANPTSN